MEKKKTGDLSQGEIDKLKKEHGVLMRISLIIEGTLWYWWFKKPDMNTLSASAAMMANGDPMSSSTIVFTNCLVHGDAEAVNNVDLFMNIAPKLQGLTETYLTEVKKF